MAPRNWKRIHERKQDYIFVGTVLQGQVRLLPIITNLDLIELPLL